MDILANVTTDVPSDKKSPLNFGIYPDLKPYGTEPSYKKIVKKITYVNH